MKNTFNIFFGVILLIILGIGSWLFINNLLQLLKSIDKQIAITAITASTTVIVSVISVLYANKQEELEIYLKEFSPKLIIWGSDEVIREWNNFRNASQENNAYNMIIKLEKVLYAIRKDVGHENNNLKETMLLNIFVNELHKLKSI